MKKIKITALTLLASILFVPSVFAAECNVEKGEAVASITTDGNTAYCATLSDAITAAQNGDTIVLEADAEVNYKGVTKDITIDMNTHNINGTGAAALAVLNGGSLTVKGKGTIYNKDTDSMTVLYVFRSVGGDITIGKDVTLESEGTSTFGIVVDPITDSVNIDFAGTIKVNGAGIYVNGTNGQGNNANAKITVKVQDGAKIDAKETGFYLAGKANTTIGAATITGDTGIGIKAGTLTLNGTTINGVGEYSDVKFEGNGMWLTGPAIQIESNKGYDGKITVVINGGTYTSKNNAAILEYADEAGTSVVEMAITDGKFTGDDTIGAINVSESFKGKNTGFITGGTFSSEIDKDFVKTGLVEKPQADGSIIIGEPRKVVVTEAENGKVTADLETAVKGETVTISATANEGYEIDTIVVKDADGKKVEVKDGKFIMPDSDVTITVTFKEIKNDDVTPTPEAPGQSTTPVTPETPKTGDGIIAIVGLGLASVVVVGISLNKLKKQTSR